MAETKPLRIQRKRTKGWKMPEGAIYVGRPTKWGNPFSHAKRYCGLEMSLRLFRAAVEHIWDPGDFKDLPDGPYQIALKDWQEWINQFPFGAINDAHSELRGKNLACWCPLDQPCHADVLLEIANGL